MSAFDGEQATSHSPRRRFELLFDSSLAIPSMCILVGLTILGVAAVRAADDKIASTLMMISDYAERICNKLPLEGRSKKMELSGEANAELRGLFKKFVDVGISGGGKFEDESYVGVVQKDLAETFVSNANCKERVSGRLESKLLPEVSEQPGPTPPVEPKGIPISVAIDQINKSLFSPGVTAETEMCPFPKLCTPVWSWIDDTCRVEIKFPEPSAIDSCLLHASSIRLTRIGGDELAISCGEWTLKVYGPSPVMYNISESVRTWVLPEYCF